MFFAQLLIFESDKNDIIQTTYTLRHNQALNLIFLLGGEL